jgi:hypothetical protein
MKRYIAPRLSDYGSIANCTFATPGSDHTPVEQNPPEPFLCNSPWAGSGEKGTKNTQVLLCDKWGEYSHPAGSSGS